MVVKELELISKEDLGVWDHRKFWTVLIRSQEAKDKHYSQKGLSLKNSIGPWCLSLAASQHFGMKFRLPPLVS
jgi:hypothetical protein